MNIPKNFPTAMLIIKDYIYEILKPHAWDLEIDFLKSLTTFTISNIKVPLDLKLTDCLQVQNTDKSND